MTDDIDISEKEVKDFINWFENYVVEDHDIIVGYMGFQFNFYIRDVWKKEVRLRLIQVANEFISSFGELIKYSYGINSECEYFDLEPFDNSKQSGLAEEYLINRFKENTENIFCLTDVEDIDISDDTKRIASKFDFYFLTLGKGMESTGCADGLLQITLPIRAFTDLKFTAPEYCEQICKILKPSHGSAGFGLTSPIVLSDAFMSTTDRCVFYETAKSYPCLEINAREIETNSDNATKDTGFLNNIRTIGWITIVSSQLLEKIGGKDGIQKATNNYDNIITVDYDGGIIVIIGDMPLLGHESDGPIPKEYGVVARLFKPIICKLTEPDMLTSYNHISYKQRDTEYENWRNRFDKL